MNKQNYILFDGICNLCNALVRFIIRHDKKSIFRFTPLQSSHGKALLKKLNLPVTFNDSMICVEGEIYYIKSNAIMHIFKRLGGAWRIFYLFIIIPSPLRNWIYNKIAASRFRIFGKKDICMKPDPEIRHRFL